ncbi:hypothetical protein [Streptomyces sp. cmx-4-9]|uniref:hypothetical protein n=1 Tax=Streptomyces sp. cmx-4-9 TaxID=2790941 RepID=UPI00397EA70A
MSDHAIPEVGAEHEHEHGREHEHGQPRAATAAPSAPGAADAPVADVPPAGEADGSDGLRRTTAEDAESLRMLLETAAALRPVEEIADLVTLLRRTGQLPDSADQALRAAAVSRPVEDVIALAVLLAEGQEQRSQPDVAASEGEPEGEPGATPLPAASPAQTGVAPAVAVHRPAPAAEPGTVPPAPDPEFAPSEPAAGVGEVPHEVLVTEVQKSTPSRMLRWPVAAALLVSAVAYVPGQLSGTPAGSRVWLMLGLAGACLVLAGLVVARDRTWVWSATTLTGIGLVSLQALTATLGVHLLDDTMAGRLPWPTGATMLCAGLVAVLSGMALLYRSEQAQRPAPRPADFVLPEAAATALDTRYDTRAGLGPDHPQEAEAAAAPPDRQTEPA